MAKAIKCDVSIEELEKYRDEEGFINLDMLNLELTEESREKVGNTNRIKNWVDFLGTEVLVKSECKIDEKTNGGIYAELIIEELANQIGIECAHYDLVKIKGEKGVLSKKMLNNSQSDLLTLQSLIGDTKSYDEYPDISDYMEVEEKLYESLKHEDIEKEERKTIIKDFRKHTAFFLMVCSVDKYAENISLITSINPETKKKELRLSPIYDSECSLMLDMDLETLEKMSKHGLGLQRNVNMLDPKIAVLDGEYKSPWKNTISTLSDNDEIYDFILDCYENLNIEDAIKKVEEKIKAPVPKIIKFIATHVFKFRRNEMQQVIYPELDEESISFDYTDEIAQKSIEEDIRQGEEDDILRKIMHIYGIEERDSNVK